MFSTQSRFGHINQLIKERCRQKCITHTADYRSQIQIYHKLCKLYNSSDLFFVSVNLPQWVFLLQLLLFFLIWGASEADFRTISPFAYKWKKFKLKSASLLAFLCKWNEGLPVSAISTNFVKHVSQVSYKEIFVRCSSYFLQSAHFVPMRMVIMNKLYSIDIYGSRSVNCSQRPFLLSSV